MDKEILKVVCAVFVEDGKIFYAQRGQAKNPQVAFKYEFIGGKVEDGESDEQALRRELSEEAEMKVEIIRPFMTCRYAYDLYTVELRVFLCKMTGEYRLKEHIDGGWTDIKELDYDLWAPADKVVLQRVQQEFCD